MSLVQSGSDIVPVAHAADLPRRVWTRAEFELAGEAGIFGPEERLELIGGEVVRKMTPQRSAHATAVSLVDQALRGAFGEGHYVRVQLPLALSEHSEPEPDLAVVVGSPRDHKASHPSSSVLIVEVADARLSYDRQTKGSLYAQANIPEYWILNLRDQVLEVHRDPAPMSEQPFGHHYRSITRFESGEVVRLQSAAAQIAVSELLP